MSISGGIHHIVQICLGVKEFFQVQNGSIEER